MRNLITCFEGIEEAAGLVKNIPSSVYPRTEEVLFILYIDAEEEISNNKPGVLKEIFPVGSSRTEENAKFFLCKYSFIP